MFASVVTVKATVTDFDMTAQMAGESLISWMRQFDGYRGFAVLSDADGGRARFMTFWEDQDSLRKSAHSRKQVREQLAKTAGAEIEGAEEYAVVVAENVG